MFINNCVVTLVIFCLLLSAETYANTKDKIQAAELQYQIKKLKEKHEELDEKLKKIEEEKASKKIEVYTKSDIVFLVENDSNIHSYLNPIIEELLLKEGFSELTSGEDLGTRLRVSIVYDITTALKDNFEGYSVYNAWGQAKVIIQDSDLNNRSYAAESFSTVGNRDLEKLLAEEYAKSKLVNLISEWSCRQLLNIYDEFQAKYEIDDIID